MNILIGDIGNTLTKICLINSKNFKVKKIIYFNSNIINSRKETINIIKKFFKNSSIKKISFFSSVVPKYEIILRDLLIKFFKIKFFEIGNKKINKIIKINVKNKNQVGSDRIANAIGACKKYKTNCIIIDFGTATTFDVVTKYGVYNGGIIAPGVNLSIKSLSHSAHKIPLFSLSKPKKIVGKNTLEALRSGFYWGYSGLINNIISKIKSETNKNYKVILTGGYANLFKTSIKKPFKIDKNITINGIIEVFKHNKKYFN